MIRAKYRTDGEGHSLVMNGHAGYAQSGDDIVCAGASSIVFALLGWLENHPEEYDFLNTDVHSGDVLVACEGGERTAVAFEMAAIGLLQLADKYPDHVAIDIVGLAD